MWKTVLMSFIILAGLGVLFSIPYWSEWSASSEEERRAASEHRRRHRDRVFLGLAPILAVMFAVAAVMMFIDRPDKPMEALFMAAVSVCCATAFVLLIRRRWRAKR